MKLRLVFGLLLALSGSSLFGETADSPLIGTWKMISGKWTENGKETASMPGTVSRNQIKMYSRSYFTFVGRQVKGEKPASDSFGGGTYLLRGEDYSETILYHAVTGAVGTTLHFNLTFKGNTMTLTGPTSSADQKNFGWQLTEVYERME